MGYRSDVAYVVKFYSETEPEKAFAEFVAFVDWVKNTHVIQDPSEKTAFSYNDFSYNDKSSDYLKFYPKDLMISFSIESVKWYQDFDEVQWHEQLLLNVEKYRTGNYRFVRTGEEYNDVEVKVHDPTYWEMHDYVDVHRSIEFSPPSETEDNEKEVDTP
jgi:hypothetical protein